MRKEYKDFTAHAQKEIKELEKKIGNILKEWEDKAQELFDEQGIDGFGETHLPEYYGVDSITLSPTNTVEESLYLFVDGLETHIEYIGWLPSSYIE